MLPFVIDWPCLFSGIAPVLTNFCYITQVGFKISMKPTLPSHLESTWFHHFNVGIMGMLYPSSFIYPVLKTNIVISCMPS